MIDLGMKEKLVRWLNSLTAKYVAVFVLLVAVPAIGISWYLLDSSYNDNKRALINQQRAQAQAIAGRIDQTLQDVLDRLGSVHGKGAKPEQVRTSLRPLILSALTPLMAFYMNGRGTDVASVGARALHVVRLGEETTSPLPTLSRAEFEQAQNGDFVSGVRPYIDSSTNQSIPMFYVATVENYGFGVVGEALAGRSTFGSLLSNARLGHGYAYAVAENGRTLDYPARLFETGTDELTDKSSQLPRTLSLPQVEDALHSSEPVGSATGENLKGTRVLSAWAVVPTARWKVFVEQPESAAFAPLRGKIWKTALLIAAFVAAAVALSILVARRLVRPIKRMRLAAARIGAGAYDERIELDPRRTVTFRGPPDVSLRRRRGLPFRGIEDPGSVVVAQPLEERTRQDDLGALAEDLNRMAASLQKSHAELEQKVDERTRELQATLEQLAIKSRELEDASKHKSEFLANMSHELRTPLNAIIGFSQVLQQKLFGEVNDKQEEYLEDIHGSANHLLALINDVLDLSKVEAGQVELEKAPFSLREALERGVVMVRERAQERCSAHARDRPERGARHRRRAPHTPGGVQPAQ